MLPTKLRGYSKRSKKLSLKEKIKKVPEGLITKVVKKIKGIKNK